MAEAVATEEVVEIVKEIAEETTADFRSDPNALPESMRGKHRQRRTESITIFMDAVAGDQYGKIETALEALTSAIGHAQEVGDEDGLARLREQYDTVSTKSDELKAALLADAYSFELRALPPVIMKGLRRETRDDLNIKTKGLSEDDEERYNELFPLKMILAQTVKFIDHGLGSEPTALTPEKLREIYEYGDEFQWLRLTGLANDLQFRNTISSSVIESADFSQRI